MSMRSYVDHWPHASADMFVKFTLPPPTLGPITNSYVSHWPEAAAELVVKTYLTAPTTGPITDSYVDHFALAGDLYASSGKGVIQGL